MVSVPALSTTTDVIELLDPYAGGLTTEAPRLEAIATISAGGKDGQRPTVSRNGVIQLHDPSGRAPGLRAALDATGGKRLTIAFPWDDDRRFVSGWLARYSASRLEAFGDQHTLTEIDPKGGRQTWPAGTPQYDSLLLTCKPYYSIYFVLAEWDRDGLPTIVMPDGYGYYRLRTTSRNSIRSLLAAIRTMQQATGGRIAGIPWDLTLDYREVADPTGAKRTVPVWTIIVQRPGGMTLPALEYRRIINAGLNQGQLLMLPAPTGETIDSEAMDLPDLAEPVEVDEALVERAVAGGTCDKAAYCKLYFAAVKGTPLDTDEARAAFITEYTDGRWSSLKGFLDQATDLQAMQMIEAVKHRVRALAQPERDAEPVDATFTEVAEPTPADVIWQELDPAPVARNGTAEWVQQQIANQEAAAPELAKALANANVRTQIRAAFVGTLRAQGYSGSGQEPVTLLRYWTGRELATWDDLRVTEARVLMTLTGRADFAQRVTTTADLLGFVRQQAL